MLGRMSGARPMGRAEDTGALPLEVVFALVEVHACSALLHVTAPEGGTAQEAVALPPPCFVWTCPTGCADDAVVLVPPGSMGALIFTAGHTVPLPPPMPADTRRPRTAFQTTTLRPPPSILLLSMRTPQVLMTLRTLI